MAISKSNVNKHFHTAIEQKELDALDSFKKNLSYLEENEMEQRPLSLNVDFTCLQQEQAVSVKRIQDSI